MDTLSGTLATGYVAEVGETPQTAGDFSKWFKVPKGEILSLTLAGTFAETTRIALRKTNNPVGGYVAAVATLAAAATTTYIVDETAWYQVYFLTQAESEEITYTFTTVDQTRATLAGAENTVLEATDAGITVTGDLTVVNGNLIMTDSINGETYRIRLENGVLTPVEV